MFRMVFLPFTLYAILLLRAVAVELSQIIADWHNFFVDSAFELAIKNCLKPKWVAYFLLLIASVGVIGVMCVSCAIKCGE